MATYDEFCPRELKPGLESLMSGYTGDVNNTAAAACSYMPCGDTNVHRETKMVKVSNLFFYSIKSVAV